MYNVHTRYGQSVLLRAPSQMVTYNTAKVQNICCIASSLKVFWYESMEWNREENFSIKWKIFGMQWKWNGKKLPLWNMEKSSSIPFHALLRSSAIANIQFSRALVATCIEDVLCNHNILTKTK